MGRFNQCFLNYVTKIWQQLGENFKNYDEHPVFETMNEPRQVGNIHEWWYADDDCCHEALECILIPQNSK